MKKRLGAIPKGLQWISDQPEQNIVLPVQQTQPEKKEETLEVPAAKRGLQEELIRATFILQQSYLEKIKAYAYWERLQIKEVFDLMCQDFFKNKKVRSIPKRK